MDEDEILRVRNSLQDVSEYRSLLFLYQEGFNLPDELNDAYKRAELHDSLRKIERCVDYVSRNLFNVNRFKRRQHGDDHNRSGASATRTDSEPPAKMQRSASEIIMQNIDSLKRRPSPGARDGHSGDDDDDHAYGGVDREGERADKAYKQNYAPLEPLRAPPPAATTSVGMTTLAQLFSKGAAVFVHENAEDDDDDDDDDESSLFKEPVPSTESMPEPSETVTQVSEVAGVVDTGTQCRESRGASSIGGASALSDTDDGDDTAAEHSLRTSTASSSSKKRARPEDTVTGGACSSATSDDACASPTAKAAVAQEEDDGDTGASAPMRANRLATRIVDEPVITADTRANRDRVVAIQSARHAIFLEMRCFYDMLEVLGHYQMEHANELLYKIVYYSSIDKKNKSITFFDLIFILMCKCKCVLATWNSAHHSRMYNVSSTMFKFVRLNSLCIERRAILRYTVKDLICAIHSLSAKWNTLDYSDDLESYVELLFLRISMLISYTTDAETHNMPRFRTVMGKQNYDDVRKTKCTANQDFISTMNNYVYSYRKRLALRSIFNNITIYDMDTLFNQRASYRVIALIGCDTTVNKLDASVQEINYEANLYGAYYSRDKCRDDRQAIDVVSAKAVGNGDEKEEARRAAEWAQARQALQLESDADRLERLRELCSPHVRFSIDSLDTMRVAYFVNDELFKFLSKPELAFKMYKWMEDRAEKLTIYGEDTMRMYRKMSLNYCIMVGEDLACFRSPSSGKNTTIEHVLKKQRGIKVFNKMQETMNKDPNKILTKLYEVFEEAKSGYSDEQTSTVFATRNPMLYAAYKRRLDSRGEGEAIEMTEHEIDTEVSVAVASAAAVASSADGNVDCEQRDEFVSAVANAKRKRVSSASAHSARARKGLSSNQAKRSDQSSHIPDYLDSKDCLYQRTRMDVFQDMVCILLVDSFYMNYYGTSWEEKFIVYEKELEDKYDSYTRSKLPVLVQTFNSFNVVYMGVTFEINNFLASFYIWLRLIDQFHGRMVSGHDTSKTYTEIFEGERYYRENCAQSLSDLLQEHQENATKENKPGDKEQDNEQESEKSIVEACF